MGEQQAAGIDEALERVVAAAREHLAAVKAAGGALDDPRVWDSYVALNNASHRYDELLTARFGESTPWETEQMDQGHGVRLPPERRTGDHPVDPYPAVISVRQRRDFRVPSVSTLLATAGQAAARMSFTGEPAVPDTVAEAVLELVRDGDGSLGGLDVPELEPLGGVLTVSELSRPGRVGDSEVPARELFAVPVGEAVVARLDEQPFSTGGPAVEPPGG